MASPARRSNRPQMNLVVDNTAKVADHKTIETNEKTARSLFIAAAIFIVITVIIGLGPVIINAEATKLSQQSILLKQDITRATTSTQNLQLDRSSLRSASRIEKIAREEMNMVPIGKNFIAIEIGPEVAATQAGEVEVEAEVATSNISKNSATDVLKNIARLTAGEASALLVGDISLATIR